MRWGVLKLNNRIKDAFDAVRAEDRLKRNTREFLAARTAGTEKAPRFRISAVAFACLALVFLSLGGWRFYMMPVSAISVDVNPSVELGINRFDRVVAVDGCNEDGVKLAAAVNLRNLNYSDAIETLLESEAMQPYIAEDRLVSITVLGSSGQKSEEMITRIRSCGYAGSHDVECHLGNRAEADAAHKAGMSFGRYRAFLELQTLDPDITAQDMQELTMRQIRDMINELSNIADDRPKGNGFGGHGGNAGSSGRRAE